MSEVSAISVGARAAALPSAGVADIIEIPRLDALPDAASRAATELLWLIDADAHPSPETLAPLLEHRDAPAVSVPVDPQGRVVESVLGRVDDDDPAALLERVAERRVPLRHTTVTSLVLERASVTSLAPPDPDRFGPYAGTEWTARLFARQRGMLVPSSRVEVRARAAGSVTQALRMAGNGSWRRGEALREIHRAVTGRVG